MHEIKVADEVFLVVADLHRSNPNAADFTVEAIVRHAEAMHISPELRPGFRTHVSAHCVANRPPNPGAYRMLYATARGQRRLLAPGDPVDPARNGRMWPESSQIPEPLRPLLAWAKQRYMSRQPEVRPLQGLIDLEGSGRHIWKGGAADQYVREVREGWQ